MIIPVVDTMPADYPGVSAEDRASFGYLRHETYLSYLPLGADGARMDALVLLYTPLRRAPPQCSAHHGAVHRLE